MKRIAMNLSLLVVLFALLGAGCTSTEEASLSPLSFNQQPIINGEAPNAPMHEAVVSLHQRSGSYVSRNIFCSGTLITPEVVLTASHCLDVSPNPKKFSTMDPLALAIYVGNAPLTDPNPAFYAVTETLIHPAYNKSQITNDIALVRLATPVTHVTPVPFLPAAKGFTSADAGQLVLNFAGFGDDENGDYSVKLQIDGLLNRIYSATQIYYLQNTGGPCFGDSGGPAFLYRNGTAYVGGITSYGDSYCSQYGVSTRTDAFETFINDFTGTTPPAPDCSANGVCNTQCAPGADPDCSTPPGEPVCGDGLCAGYAQGEDCMTCPADCATISHPKKGVLACCGNGACESRESADSCAVDCQ